MIKKQLQKMANKTIKRMENSISDEEFEFHLNFGMWLDGISIRFFNIYLD